MQAGTITWLGAGRNGRRRAWEETKGGRGGNTKEPGAGLGRPVPDCALRPESGPEVVPKRYIVAQLGRGTRRKAGRSGAGLSTARPSASLQTHLGLRRPGPVGPHGAACSLLLPCVPAICWRMMTGQGRSVAHVRVIRLETVSCERLLCAASAETRTYWEEDTLRYGVIREPWESQRWDNCVVWSAWLIEAKCDNTREREYSAHVVEREVTWGD